MKIGDRAALKFLSNQHQDEVYAGKSEEKQWCNHAQDTLSIFFPKLQILFQQESKYFALYFVPQS